MSFKWKKIFTRLAIGLLVIIAAGLVVRAVLNYTTGKKLSRTILAFKERGIALTLAELETECPDRDNAAIFWKAAEELTLPGEERRLLGDNVRDLFSGSFPGEANEEILRRMVNDFSPLIRFVREAAAKPCFKYEKDWGEKGENMRLPDAVRMIIAARLMAADAVFKSSDGYEEEAVDECLEGIRFVILQMKSPTIIWYLISMANMKNFLVPLRWILSKNDLPVETLQKVRNQLDVLPWSEAMTWALETERALGFDAAMNIIRGGKIIVDKTDGLPVPEASFQDRFFSWCIRPLYKSQAAWMLNFWEKVIPLGSVPYYDIEDPVKAFSESIIAAPKSFKWAKMMIPNIATVKLKLTTLEAMLITADVGIACRIYQKENGKYPKSLEELVPRYLDELPPDPFTGKALYYRVEESGFRVYSLGSNRKDDGGRGTLYFTKMVMDKDDDWSWERID